MPPRTPLSNSGGEIRVAGDPAFSGVLATAVEHTSREPDSLTHGFHSFPARMHPAIAEHLLLQLAKPGMTIFDPFCGSGTTLVESIVHGYRAFGSDLNPLAIRLAKVKTERRDQVSRARFLEITKVIATASEDRVRTRVQTLAKLSREEIAWYEPHTLKELAGLWDLIGQVDPGPDRDAFQMVFSAIVTKFSKQRADTAEEKVDRRIRKGLPTEFFVRKAEELVERWAQLDEILGDRKPDLRFENCDVRELSARVPMMWHADLVITSPPYGGTYDYVDHHARRFAWFGYDVSKFEAQEVGARRNISVPRDGADRWDAELRDILLGIVKCMKPNALMAVWMGDGESRGQRINADEQIERLADRARLEPLAIASQPRRDWKNGPEREEHLMLLRKR